MASWVELAGRPVPWARPHGGPPFVLLTRVQHFRNFAGEPFPISASPEAAARLALGASAYASRHGLPESHRLADCPIPVLRTLRERHLLAEPPVPLAGKKGIKHLCLGPAEDRFAWINEVEQLSVIESHAGLLSPDAFSASVRPPPEEPDHPWARTAGFGYLSSHPARTGPGIGFRILVHLPALSLARRLGQAQSSMAALGVDFLPVTRAGHGHGPQAQDTEPALFWLASRGGLGRAAGRVYDDFIADVQPLLSWEREAQEKCLGKHRKRLEDRVQGSLRQLSEARSIGLPALRLAGSWARLGAYTGILDAQIPTLLEELRAKAQSGHLEVSSGRPLDKVEEDTARASVVRLAMERHRDRA